MDDFPFGPRYFFGEIFGLDDDEYDAQVQFNVRQNPWDLRNSKFIKLFRVNKPLARELIDMLQPRLPVVRRSSEMPSDIKVLSSLRFFASGSYQYCVAQDRLMGVSQSSISRNLHDVLRAMAPLIPNIVKFPTEEGEIRDAKLRFWEKHQFPGTVGAVDCTHIAIFPPPKNHAVYPEYAFINRKRFHSINTQVIADADRKILAIWPKFPGRVHDSFIWHQSSIRRHLQTEYENNRCNYWLIGDSGYGLEPTLMKPIAGAIPGTPESRFNQHLTSARSNVESAIGILKNRWRCLLRHRTLHYSPPVAAKIISCCAALHNMCLRENVPLILNDGEEMTHEEFNNEEDVFVDALQGQVVRNMIVRNYFTN